MNTEGATSDPSDPDLADCGITGSGKATVWYTYTPGSDGAISIDTDEASTDYDTFVAVWTGSPGSLSMVACNNNISDTNNKSAIALQVSGSTQYYIEVGQP